MREYIRRHVPLIIAMLVVVAVAASEVGAQPTAPADDDRYQVAASGNAAKVDGLDAVKAGATKKKRAGKLVATNKKGLLPANIVRPFWWAIQAKPGAFADGQIAWAEVVGTPGGFADGTDNVGYSSLTQPTVYDIGAAGTFSDQVWVWADTPPGSDVELTIIPAPGSTLEVIEEWWTQGPDASVPVPVPAGTLRHWYYVKNYYPATTFKVRTRVFNTGIAPAALKKAPNKVKVGVTKKGPKRKKKH